MNAQDLLNEIRKLVDTTYLPTEVFSELCQAALFYAKGFSAVDAAKLAVEDYSHLMAR